MIEVLHNRISISSDFYTDQGEIQLLSESMQKKTKSSRCDVAVFESVPFGHGSSRQFALMEAAVPNARQRKIRIDSLKVVQAGRDALAVLQRTTPISRANLSKIAVPVFVYTGML